MAFEVLPCSLVLLDGRARAEGAEAALGNQPEKDIWARFAVASNSSCYYLWSELISR